MRLQRQFEALRELLENRLEGNPRDADARLERARLHAQSGHWEQAAQDADAVLRFQPANAQALYIRSKTYQQARKPAERRQALADAVQSDPTLLSARMELAGLLAGSDVHAALDMLERAPSGQHASPVWRQERNWALLRARRWDELERELAREPDPPGWHAFAVQRGLLALARNRYAQARAAVTAALKTNPADLVALDIAVRAWMAEHRADEAAQLIQQQLQQAGHPPEMLDFQARFLLSLGRRVEARAVLERGEKSSSTFAPTQILLAQMEMESSRPAAAGVRLERAARLWPTRADVWLAWGDAQVRLQQTEAALISYRKTLDLQPDNPLALNNIAHLTAEVLGRPNEALPYALKARETGAEIPAVDNTLGWILCRRGLWSAAVPHLEHSRALQAEPQVTYRLAIAYAKTGNLSKGRQMYAEAARQDPSRPEAREALAALNQSR
jgi:cellulose synthase operon protein C